MPFTFSHPAIVLPLAYLSPRWISVTGLVVGSLTPDFEYFLRMRINTQFSHENWGVLWFDLPLGLLLTFVFHQIVRNPLLANAPHFLKARFTHLQSFDWLNHFRHHWLAIIGSIMIGAISHLFWDRFTHEHAYFVDLIPVLNEQVVYHPYSFTWYRVVQHTSTLIGAITIIWVIYKLPTQPVSSQSISLRFWTVALLVAILVIALRVLLGTKSFQIGNLVVSTISAGMIGLIAGSLWWKFFEK